LAKTKVKVNVLDAVVDGKGKGAKLEIDERSARYLESIGYVEIEAQVEEKKPKQTKAKAKAKSDDK